MVFRRRFGKFRRRRRFRRRRFGTGRSRFRRRVWGNKPKMFVRTDTVGNSIASSAGPNGNTITFTNDGAYLSSGTGNVSEITYYSCAHFFSLSSVYNSGTFTQLFDRYKILGVKVRIVPYSTQTPMDNYNVSTQQASSWMIHSVIDYDDATPVSSSATGVQAISDRPSYRWNNMLDPRRLGHKRYLRPRIAVAAYSGTFTSYTNMKSPWIDQQSPAVQHYGLKWVMQVVTPFPATSSTFWFRVESKYYFAFKDPL